MWNFLSGKGKSMQSFQYKITESEKTCEYRAGLLAREAMKFTSSISIDNKDRTGDAKRFFSLAGLKLEKGNEVTVETEGEDEARAAVCLSDFFRKNL